MTDQWAQKKVEEFQFTFDQADKDKSGCLSFDEVYNVLVEQGFKGTKDEAKTIFEHMDRDSSKSVSKAEFRATITNMPRQNLKEFHMRKLFKAMDKNGSGYLDKAEIQEAANKELSGVLLTTEKINEILDYLAKDSDSKIDFEEFLTLSGINAAAEALKNVFEKLDADGNGYLTKDEILAGVKKSFELKLNSIKIFDLLTHLRTDDDQKISSEEFLSVWLKQGRK